MVASKSLSAQNLCSKRTLSWLLGSCLLLTAYGCGQPEPVATTTAEPEAISEPNTITEATEVVPPAATQDPVEPVETNTRSVDIALSTSAEESAAAKAVTERIETAGITDAQATKDFIARMREAAIAGDHETIASLVNYPFVTYDAGEPTNTYETASDLLADYEQVVTPSVIEAMAEAQYADLFVNYQGAMIGDGAVWFSQFGDEIEITAINGL